MKQPKKFKSAGLGNKGQKSFFQIALSVDCVIFGYDNNELKILAIKSDLKEFAGQWSLLGDLVQPSEDLDQAPYRVLSEKTGLKNVFLRQVHAFGGRKRHPYGRVVTVAYYALIDISNHQLKVNNNELSWVPVRMLKKMAFDHHGILNTCLSQLCEQIFERPILFNLLPPRFTLRSLQALYESVLGEALDRRNFRKKIAGKHWLRDTGEMETGVVHRPGRLYALKPEVAKKGV